LDECKLISWSCSI